MISKVFLNPSQRENDKNATDPPGHRASLKVWGCCATLCIVLAMTVLVGAWMGGRGAEWLIARASGECSVSGWSVCRMAELFSLQ